MCWHDSPRERSVRWSTGPKIFRPNWYCSSTKRLRPTDSKFRNRFEDQKPRSAVSRCIYTSAWSRHTRTFSRSTRQPQIGLWRRNPCFLPTKKRASYELPPGIDRRLAPSSVFLGTSLTSNRFWPTVQRRSIQSLTVAECDSEVSKCPGIPNGRPSNTKKVRQTKPAESFSPS